MKPVVFFAAAAAALWAACAKPHPCLAEHGVRNCTELFEKQQQNLHDPDRSIRLQECYDRACR